jgi:hypothetical protein
VGEYACTLAGAARLDREELFVTFYLFFTVVSLLASASAPAQTGAREGLGGRARDSIHSLTIFTH